MQKIKYFALTGMLAGVLLLLSGCFMRGTDNLYSVPKRSNAYLSLQEEVEAAIGGVENYCAPISGENRQAIQQADLDGDGKDEYIVYARAGEEKPLKIFVFQRGSKDYTLKYTVEGEGSAFDSVNYAQIDGTPGQELIVGRRVGDQVPQALSVYHFRQGEIAELVSTNYTGYCISDVDQDGLTDLFAIRSDTEQHNAIAELYRWHDGALARDNEVSLSVPAESYKRTAIGSLTDGTPAFFVAGTYDENNIITDVVTLADGILRNITISDESGVSASTVRNYYVYSTDIDGDGVMEIPNTEQLVSVDWDAQTENQYIIIWSAVRPDGKRVEKLRTYHNYADGWYLTLPAEWTNQLMVSRRTRGISMSYEFYQLQPDGRAERFLSIYTVSDENAAADLTGTVLASWNGTSYMAYADAGGLASGLSAEELQSMFRSIATDQGTSDTNSIS